MPSSVSEINFFDPKTNDCPYPAYEILREEAPVWQDPRTGMYFVSRYEDIRAILLDTERFSNGVGNGANNTGKAVQADDPIAQRALRLAELYEEKGWTPAPSLDARDEPNHMQMRRMFDHAFRPAAIKGIDSYVEDLAYSLIAKFIDKGRAEIVSEYAVPLPLYVIGRQVGVPDEDLPQIKIWTERWIERMGLMQTDEEAESSVLSEIDAQHYFQPRFEELRREPDDTLLSTLVNREIPEWGRPLNDNELHAEMMADLFVGGSETTTNALAAGVMLLIENPDVWQKLTADPETYLNTFCEEVLRVESPVQGLLREAVVDIEIQGVKIPAGSVMMLRYGAANRDDRVFECPAQIDLDRDKPRRHLAFGVGLHHCLGAPLARRELFYGFKAIVDTIEEMWFIDGANDFSYHPNFFLRAVRQVHIGFKPRAVSRRSVVERAADTVET